MEALISPLKISGRIEVTPPSVPAAYCIADSQQLFTQVHEWAVGKGWWENPDRPWNEQRNNFLSEIAEAWEEYRGNRLETWFLSPGSGLDPKPEGFWIEIADFLIRLADSAAAAKIDGIATTSMVYRQGFDAVRLCEELFMETAKARDFRQDSWAAIRFLDCVYSLCFSAAKIAGVDLWAAINLKMNYNATRAYRHGGKRA